ncbi:MAG: PKD domain-containing protein, partial [Methanoregulaceae archaeon]|nr:PKD domain-containing protein [Methanoregulaceae archaeon]
MDLRLILRFTVILTVLAGCLAMPVLGDGGGPPPMPHSFWGSATVGESPAPAGSNVSGTADGGGGFVIVQEPGIYATTGLSQKLMIQGSISEGAPITFFVDGIPAVCRESSSSDWQESFPFESGGFTYLEIKAAGQMIPVANFTASPRQGEAPLFVQFTDLSTGSPDHWVWNFGDGTSGATARNPSHIYTLSGNHTVSLTVWNSQGSSSITYAGYITVTPPVPGVPVANFVGNPTAGFVPLHVQFTDLSTGVPDSWQWNFGDGSPNSTDKNPVHTYDTPGTYPVSLTANNSFGTGTMTRTKYITATALPPPPVVDFTADVTYGDAPLPVQFAGTATGTPFDWAWNFGDNTSGSGKNPLHLYASPGTYSVSVVATDVGGTGNAARPGYITALLPPPLANFSATPQSGYFPFSVNFTDQSTGWPAAWVWDFGDNSTNSTEQNPLHQYADLGSFNVTLTVENARGNDTLEKSAFITVLEPTSPVADFTASPVLGMQPLLVTFSDRSVGSPTSWIWDFGDGSGST